MAASLEQIVAATRRRIAESRAVSSHGFWETEAAAHRPRGFRRSLLAASRTAPAIIAELKKASPSKGLIRSDFPVAALARELEMAGAAALSVLTDQQFFQGSLENLRVASANTQLPCLCKDFIVDRSQIPEARAHGADAILLIVAALAQDELLRLVGQARDYQIDVLFEAHNETELERALDAGCDLVGVNARDLRTFQVDLGTVFRLAAKLPPGVVAVAESGIRSGTDVAQLRARGYQGFLIGESLMMAASPGHALQQFLAQAALASPEP